MTTTTSTPEHLLVPSARTEVEVRLDPGGRVRVRTRTSGRGPRLRAVLTGSDASTAHVSLVPDGALLLDGDRVELACDVGPGTTLVLTEPGGTVAYPMPVSPATWDVDLRVGKCAGLRWHGQPFVAAAGSRTRRRTSIDLADTARLLLRETLVLGRHGEVPGRIETGTTVTRGGRLLLREDLDLDADAQVPGVLGGTRVHDLVLAIGLDGLPDSPGRLDLASEGTLYRALETASHRTGLDAVWHASAEAFAQSATEE